MFTLQRKGERILYSVAGGGEGAYTLHRLKQWQWQIQAAAAGRHRWFLSVGGRVSFPLSACQAAARLQHYQLSPLSNCDKLAAAAAVVATTHTTTLMIRGRQTDADEEKRRSGAAAHRHLRR